MPITQSCLERVEAHRGDIAYTVMASHFPNSREFLTLAVSVIIKMEQANDVCVTEVQTGMLIECHTDMAYNLS